MAHRSTSNRATGLLLLLCLTLTLSAGCAGDEDETAGPPPDYAELLAGAPPRLAAIHEQANQLIDAGPDGLADRIEELRGLPVVVNVWASWCGPCRAEFPHLQEVSGEMGKRVAFLGVDSGDLEDDAAEFLAENPVPYPSYLDPDRSIHSSLGARGFPTTAFYDREGNRTFVKQGFYPSVAELRADVRRYALGRGSG